MTESGEQSPLFGILPQNWRSMVNVTPLRGETYHEMKLAIFAINPAIYAVSFAILGQKLTSDS